MDRNVSYIIANFLNFTIEILSCTLRYLPEEFLLIIIEENIKSISLYEDNRDSYAEPER